MSTTLKQLMAKAVEQAHKDGVKWQQTSAGREYIGRRAKINHARFRKEGYKHFHKNSVPQQSVQPENSKDDHEKKNERQEKEQQIAYAFGHVESWLQIFASVAGLPQRELTERVGELLLGKGNRKMVRA